jgi:hypothetical protein
MNFQKLIEFRYLRDVTLILVVRELGFSVSQALEIEASQNLVFASDRNNALFLEYSDCRNAIFPKAKFLFPTEDGERYSSDKFLVSTHRVAVEPPYLARKVQNNLKLPDVLHPNME